MDQEETLCDETETVQEFTYLGDRVRAGGGCEAAETARTRCGWIKCRECGELLHGRKFSLKQKWAVYKSYTRPAIPSESEAWFRINRDGNFADSEINMLSTNERFKELRT